MDKRSRVPIERPRIARGLCAAAIVGWTLIVPLPSIDALATMRGWPPWWSPPYTMPPFLDAFAIVGLPLSFIFCFAVGLPAWLVASWRGLRRRRDAALVGALAGVLLDIPLTALRLAGSGGQPYQDAVTRFLLSVPAVAVYIVAVGAVAGLVARWASGIRSLVERDMAGVFT